eukprot:9141009-Pyramimonas_sp.AAC.1
MHEAQGRAGRRWLAEEEEGSVGRATTSASAHLETCYWTRKKRLRRHRTDIMGKSAAAETRPGGA